MVRMTVLASGSRGNCAMITAGRTSVLVDAGLSCRELVRRMLMAGEDPRRLDAILITHEHGDHVQGLSVLARRLGIPVYFTSATHRAWMRWMVPAWRMSYAEWLAGRRTEAARKAEDATAETETSPEPEARTAFDRDEAFAECAEDAEAFACEAEPAESIPTSGKATTAGAASAIASSPAKGSSTDSRRAAHPLRAGEPEAVRPEADPCALPGVEYFEAGKRFSVGDLHITPFTIPHDAADPVGFVLEGEGIRIGLATDLGYLPANVSQQLRRCDVVMLESNHDLEMLRDGPYPWSVKQRVLSRVGHLSNAAAAEFFEKSYDGQAAYVVLAHLSESNNLPELARVAAEWALRERANLLANRLVVAGQHAPTEPICL